MSDDPPEPAGPRTATRTPRARAGAHDPLSLPPVAADVGVAAVRRFLASPPPIPNRNTRMAYARVGFQSFARCDRHRIRELADMMSEPSSIICPAAETRPIRRSLA